MLLTLTNPWGVDLTLLTSPVGEPHLGGNKYHKLTGFLSDAKATGVKKLITMAGAHSNHLRAFATLARRGDFTATAIIRGEELSDPVRQSHEIRYALEQGVHCHFVSRARYRDLRAVSPGLRQSIIPAVDFSDGLFIPEGGRGYQALTGLGSWAREAAQFDEIWLPVATGTTAAGFLAATRFPRVMAVQVLRNAAEVLGTLNSLVPTEVPRVQLVDTATRFRFGHRAAELKQLARQFSTLWRIDLDAEYMARVLYAFGGYTRAQPVPGRVLFVQTYNR